MGFSPYTEVIRRFVTANPGCSKADVARHITYRRNFRKSYPIVNTAIKNGIIIAKMNGNKYQLCPNN